MLLRFTKSPPAARADSLLCLRPDGTRTSAALPRQGTLPHLAVHFVVESTLAWTDALFGRVAAGHSLVPDPSGLHGYAPPPANNVQARQTEALVSCLEAAQWSGAAAPAEFLRQLRRASRTFKVPAPTLTPADIDRLHLALRDFGAAWRPLPATHSLDRTFPP